MALGEQPSLARTQSVPAVGKLVDHDTAKQPLLLDARGQVLDDAIGLAVDLVFLGMASIP